MNCLCCGKALHLNDEKIGWHKRCIKRFFRTKTIPDIQIDDDALKALVTQATNKGFTVPGVQKKLSLHLSTHAEAPRLTLVDYPTGYILKPQVKEFMALPEAEQLVMCMADAAGISTVPHALIAAGKGYAYITKRVDRVFSKNKVQMLAMEDFCQLDLRLTQDKYRGSYERCGKIIERYSSRKGFDLTELFMRLVFCHIVGNSDMHLKNFSLIETSESSGNYALSPAYDFLPVNIIMPEDKEECALALNGKKSNLHKKDFLLFADSCGISRISAEKMIAKLVSTKPKFIAMCNDSLLPAALKERLSELIEERTKIFE